MKAPRELGPLTWRLFIVDGDKHGTLLPGEIPPPKDGKWGQKQASWSLRHSFFLHTAHCFPWRCSQATFLWAHESPQAQLMRALVSEFHH